MIYLDYTANTPVDPSVLKVFNEVAIHFPANPNSSHAMGRKAQEKMQEVTLGIAELLGVQPDELIYTSGATEANNLAIKGLARAERRRGRHIISTPLEHSSVSGALTALQDQGWEIDLLDIGRDGKVDPGQIRELIRKDTVLVSVCAVDSELGTVQPVHEIAEILADYPRCAFHVDATQAIGKIPVSFEGIDLVSFTAHKFYGLNGAGVLYKRKGIVLEPQMSGGVSTTLYRSGTPDLAGAAALEAALEIALQEEKTRTRRIAEMNAFLRKRLTGTGTCDMNKKDAEEAPDLPKYDRVRINSPEDAVPHILNLSVMGVKGDDFQQALSDEGICVSVKSACSVKGTPSRPVYAVSRDRKRALSSWRISLSHLTTQQETDEFLERFDRVYHNLVR